MYEKDVFAFSAGGKEIFQKIKDQLVMTQI